MEAPAQIEPRSTDDYLEVMSKAVFQTGISWQVVEKKWPGIKEAFRGFDAEAVATLSPDDVDALMQDTRVVRNRRKLEAIVENARQMVDMEAEHGSFRAYLRSHGGFEPTVKDLRRRFKFLGDMGAYYFLWVVREEVPDYHAWCASRGREPAHA
jgi:3-methyladenine DNA glycosylase Tag